MLNIHCLQDVLGWELLDLSIGDGAHESGLSAAVWAAEPIALAPLQIQDSIVEQDLGTYMVSRVSVYVLKIKFAFRAHR